MAAVLYILFKIYTVVLSNLRRDPDLAYFLEAHN